MKSTKALVTWLFSLMILGLIQSIFASPMTSSCTLKNYQNAANIYLYLNSKKFQNPTKEDLEKFFTPDVTMITNNITLASGYKQFVKHMKLLNKEVKDIHFYNLKYISSDANTLVTQYEISGMSPKNKPVHITVMLALTFNHQSCKIANWNEVVAADNLSIKSIKVNS